MNDPSTFTEALCAQTSPDLFFVEGKGSYPREAIRICSMCTHRIECAEYAIGYYNLDGLWGGLSPAARARIRRERGIKGKSITDDDLPRSTR